MSGSKILRVHDVKEALECVKLYNALTKASWILNLVLFSIFKKNILTWKFSKSC
jgi:hypothetical protein